MRYFIGSLRDNQRTWSCLIWIDCVWKKSVDNEALVAWPSRDGDGARCDKTWHDVTWHDVTLRDMTWRDMRYITWHDVTWRDMTWHDVTWRDMTWHNATWRDMTRRDVTQHDVTWRAIRISTQQEWTLLHVRWLRYWHIVEKLIKPF